MKTVREIANEALQDFLDCSEDASTDDIYAAADALDAELSRLRNAVQALEGERREAIADMRQRLATARAEGRNEGLDEAAKICGPHRFAEDLAAEIRVLKTPAPETGGGDG